MGTRKPRSGHKPSPELIEIRRIALVAVFADDDLMDRVVLKGGNALSLVYEIGGRASIDLDFSIDGDFEDIDEVQRRLAHSLTRRFETNGYSMFNFRFERRPREAGDERLAGRWGGYQATFKVIRKSDAERLGWATAELQRQAIALGPQQQRTFTIDFSKHEFCAPKLLRNLDSFQIFVYSPTMLVVEKLRALCQQNEEYALNRHTSPRGRDFYDIYQLVESLHVTPQSISEILRDCFEAKEVPLRLLLTIGDQREFHRQDWPNVVDSLNGKPEEFDFYVEFVLNLIVELKALGVIDAPG